MSWINSNFTKIEHLKSIDTSILATFEIIEASDFNEIKYYEFEKLHELIKDAIGEDRYIQFVYILNKKNELIYQSENSLLLDTFEFNNQWTNIDKNEYSVRIFSHRDKKSGLKVLVGQKFNYPRDPFSIHSDMLWLMTILIIAIGGLSSYFIVRLSFKPMEKLSNYFVEVSQEENGIEKLDKALALVNKRDELGRLILSFKEIMTKLQNLNSEQNKIISQIAHEIKLPLTIIAHSAEFHSNSSQSIILSEVKKINEIINSFLGLLKFKNQPWAFAEVHAIKLKHLIYDIKKSFEIIYPHRLEIDEISEEIRVIANPFLFQQVIENLILNSLKHTTGSVKIIWQDNLLRVIDEGEGISQDVLVNLGKAFNYHGERAGHGMGLAWVYHICKKCHWELLILNKSHKNATEVQVNFSQSII